MSNRPRGNARSRHRKSKSCWLPESLRWRFYTLLLTIALTAGAFGCSKDIAGSWETVQVRPAGASFPFNRIQFDAGTYTAMGLYDGEGRMAEDVQTTTGDYRQSGSALQFKPHKGASQSYHVRRRLDGKLEIVMKQPGGKSLTAVLAPGN